MVKLYAALDRALALQPAVEIWEQVSCCVGGGVFRSAKRATHQYKRSSAFYPCKGRGCQHIAAVPCNAAVPTQQCKQTREW